ncbi:hypothetical protein BGZ65_011562 [Modicella reniformis]|uniref:cAMP-independent regulatory protein pac2 n=1 Tax=Modicella reniformis TaxID=1440133 RepID=A0A9P6SNM7_9FUNG|nr:hypothetical protein BGZ65_011562 [Modicella reniformis]
MILPAAMDPNSMETYYGLIKTPHDALIIFEGKYLYTHANMHPHIFSCVVLVCHLGIIPRVHRRLSDIERQCVRSGSVYCFDEREAGMRRWTDGKSWSPSRVTGSFLTYRELDDTHGTTSKNAYRPDGLFKQSFSITTSDNKKLHLISYYKNDDVASDQLFVTPSRDPRFAHIIMPKGIYPETSSSADSHAQSNSASSSADSHAQSSSASSTNHSTPSPPTRLRHRPHHRIFHHNEDDREMIRRPESSPYAAAAAAGHRRTHSGSLSVNEHRYSPTPSIIDNSRSHTHSHNLGYSASSYEPYESYGSVSEKRYKSSSPAARSSFPTPPRNAYSPTASWASDDEQPLVGDAIIHESLENYNSEFTPLLATCFDHHKTTLSFGHEPYSSTVPFNHEQDSLSILADLATDMLLLPTVEPKEISRERARWVEDDRQLRAVSSLLRL